MKLCGFDVGLDRPLFLIAGPDTLESEQLCLDVAGRLKEHTARLGMPYIFKGSFDKANRSSGKSYRGPGMAEGLKILESVKKRIDSSYIAARRSVKVGKCRSLFSLSSSKSWI